MDEMDKEVTATDSVKISEEVIAVITSVAAGETDGVVSVGTNGIASNWTEMLSGKKNASKGIKIVMQENSVSIEINIVVKYGVCIPDVALAVQKAIKNAVEEMTGMEVIKTDVRVVGIKSVSEVKKVEEPENPEK